MMRRTIGRVLRKFVRPQWPPCPVAVRHSVPTWLLSMDDEPISPSPRLIDDAIRATERATTIDLTEVSNRIRPPGIRYPDVWPGEHYRLLAAIVDVLRPKLVVEVGTASGMSALAMRQSLTPDARLVTFDIIPWRRYPDVLLTDADFVGGRLEQRLADLANPASFQEHANVLAAADLLFVDAPKDGRFEPAFMRNLEGLRRATPLLVVLDDIRLENMLNVWRGIRRPKLDLTSFGHWSGTGLIDWTP